MAFVYALHEPHGPVCYVDSTQDPSTLDDSARVLEAVPVDESGAAVQRWVAKMWAEGQNPVRKYAAGVAQKRTTRKGENSNLSTLTEQDVIDLRSRLIAGDKLAVIAEDLGVTRPAVWMAATGKSWSHVPGAVIYSKSMQKYVTLYNGIEES
jgi:hypothetical protein